MQCHEGACQSCLTGMCFCCDSTDHCCMLTAPLTLLCINDCMCSDSVVYFGLAGIIVCASTVSESCKTVCKLSPWCFSQTELLLQLLLCWCASGHASQACNDAHLIRRLPLLQALRTCPVCRMPCWFVTPSSVWPATREDKDRIVAGYKAKLGQIDCRHWNFGANTCPFGTSCFYRHVYPDGRPQVSSVPSPA